MKKLLALVLALVMTLSLCVTSNAAYADAADIDYKEAVDVMSAIGVLEGADGKFNPDGILTREQAAKIIAYMLLGKTAADSLSTASAPFADVAADRWSAGAIAYCASEGIIAGVGNKMFDPTGTLTGYQFSKMLLVALGYDAGNEGMTGPDWQINVAKLVIDLKLNDGMTDVVLSQGLSRQAAAKLAFNALDEYVVRYTGGVTVNAGNDTTVKVGATLTTTGNKFRAVYFNDLSSSTPGDDFGRPATKWVWKNQSVGTYPKTPAHVYTADMDTTAGNKAVKADLKDYVFSDTLASDRDSYEDVADLTGNGKVVEVFVSKNVVTNVVEIEYTCVAVTKVAKDKVTLTGGLEIDDEDDLYDVVKGLAKKDLVMVCVDGSTVLDAYVPTTVTGKLTKIKDGACVVGGEEYKDQYDFTSSFSASTDLNELFVLTLDKYGYVVDIDDDTATADSKVYAYVLDAEENSARGTKDWGAKLLFTDGTVSWVDVTAVDGDDIDDCTSGDLTTLITKFVSYEVKNGKYQLTPADTNSKTAVTYTKGSTSFATYTGTNSTIFVVKNADKTYSVYTGIKNMPSFTGADVKILYDGGTAVVAYITDAASTDAKDQVFVYGSKDEVEKDGSRMIYTYKAIVNGEDTTIGIADDDSVADGLYVDSGYTKNYITALNTVNTGSKVKVVKYTDGLVDITLNKGNLTIDANSDTVKVVDDDFQAWYVAAGNNKVEELNLDKTDTFGASADYAAVASGDYVVYVVNGDGYVTDLYFYDNNGTL